MNFNEVTKNCTINCMAGIVPCVIGHAGVGKSQLPKAVKKKWIELNNTIEKDESKKLTEDDIDIVILFGSLIKEGELGGIPVTSVQEIDGRRKAINDYTTHVKMQRILDNHDQGKITLLFIDEINRCENAVQQELMQLILDKQINQTYLPDSCAIICAGNPEVDDFVDYQVTVMNDALKNRFVQYTMESDTEEWIKWASRASEDDPSVSNVDDDVIEFIAEFTNMLHNYRSTEAIKPTPRGVFMFSESYRIAKMFFVGDELEEVVLHQAVGICGTSWANSFISFIRNKENPLVKPEEILKSDKKEYDAVIARIKKEGPLRQFIIIDRLVKKMEKMVETKELNAKTIGTYGERFNDVLEIIPKDSMIGVIKDVFKNHTALYNVMIETDRFMNIFLDTNKMANQAG